LSKAKLIEVLEISKRTGVSLQISKLKHFNQQTLALRTFSLRRCVHGTSISNGIIIKQNTKKIEKEIWHWFLWLSFYDLQ
jgi:hypothetical protein